MAKYEIKNPDDLYWDSLWKAIEKDGEVKHPYDIDSYLKKYNGKVYLDESYGLLKVVKGIEFKTDEDLTFFKLKFN